MGVIMSLFSDKVQVKITSNYSQFKMLEGNRGVNILRVKKIKESMKEKVLLSPIIVNEFMEIVDGQHRFEAFKDLSMPVHYLVQKGLRTKDAVMYNTNTKNWTSKDYIEAQVSMDNLNYIRLKNFMNRYKLAPQFCVEILSAHHDRSNRELMDKFRSGRFEIRSWNTAVEFADNIEAMKAFYAGNKRLYFLRAMWSLHNNPAFKFPVLMSKLKYLSVRMVDCPSKKDYMRLIEELYNYKNRSKKVRLF
jgi:hypothetical protein